MKMQHKNVMLQNLDQTYELQNLGLGQWLDNLEKREKFTEKFVPKPKSRYEDPFFTGFNL